LQDEGLRFLCSKAEIIDELETTLPDWVRSPTWHPHFVHILKFHPDSTYEVWRWLTNLKGGQAAKLRLWSMSCCVCWSTVSSCTGLLMSSAGLPDCSKAERLCTLCNFQGSGLAEHSVRCAAVVFHAGVNGQQRCLTVLSLCVLLLLPAVSHAAAAAAR
jgi:hypothetical protein